MSRDGGVEKLLLFLRRVAGERNKDFEKACCWVSVAHTAHNIASLSWTEPVLRCKSNQTFPAFSLEYRVGTYSSTSFANWQEFYLSDFCAHLAFLFLFFLFFFFSPFFLFSFFFFFFSFQYIYSQSFSNIKAIFRKLMIGMGEAYAYVLSRARRYHL